MTQAEFIPRMSDFFFSRMLKENGKTHFKAKLKKYFKNIMI